MPSWTAPAARPSRSEDRSRPRARNGPDGAGATRHRAARRPTRAGPRRRRWPGSRESRPARASGSRSRAYPDQQVHGADPAFGVGQPPLIGATSAKTAPSRGLDGPMPIGTEARAMVHSRSPRWSATPHRQECETRAGGAVVARRDSRDVGEAPARFRTRHPALLGIEGRSNACNARQSSLEATGVHRVHAGRRDGSAGSSHIAGSSERARLQWRRWRPGGRQSARPARRRRWKERSRWRSRVRRMDVCAGRRRHPFDSAARHCQSTPLHSLRGAG